MDELLPVLLATQVSAALAALGLALNQWLAMKSASRELKAKLAETSANRQDLELLLSALSNAERDGIKAMEAALDRNDTAIAKAIHDLKGAKRAVILKALTQPSDARRKRFVYELASAEET